MAKGTILDNDVMIKISCYRLVENALDLLSRVGPVGGLGLTRIVVPKQIGRAARIIDKAAAITELNRLFAALQFIEPDENEIVLAAEFEAAAAKSNLPLDSGESQMIAVLLRRSLALMITGDKGAIASVETLAARGQYLRGCTNRVACLEQVILALLERISPVELRSNICREPKADRTVATCFSCTSDVFTGESARDGLDSYIQYLRISAPTVLFPTNNLSIAA